MNNLLSFLNEIARWQLMDIERVKIFAQSHLRMRVPYETWILDVVINSFHLLFFQLFPHFDVVLGSVYGILFVHLVFQNRRFNEHEGLVKILGRSNAWYWKLKLLFLVKHHFVQLDHFSEFHIFFFVFLKRSLFAMEFACYVLAVH